jgi:hypothetical protein
MTFAIDLALVLSSPLPLRGGVGGGGCPVTPRLNDNPHPNPSPKGEGLCA